MIKVIQGIKTIRRGIPVVFSAEMAECGLACMVMVAHHHGHDIDLNALRKKYPISLSGAHVRSLIGIGSDLGLAARPIRVDIDDLPKIRTPAILHWDFNHFVVLTSFRGRQAVIHDPARGRVRLTVNDLSNHFTGVALEFSPAANFARIADRSDISFLDLISDIRGLKSSFFAILAASLAVQIGALAAPWQVQVILDGVLPTQDGKLLLDIAIAFSLVMILQHTIGALRDLGVQMLGNKTVFNVVGNIVRHLLQLPSSFFEKRHMADIISRISAVKNIQEAVTQGILSTVIDALVSTAAALALFAYSPFLATIVFLSLCLTALLSWTAYGAICRATEEMIVDNAKEQSHLMETIRAISTIKLLGRESDREYSWRNLYAKGYNSSIRLARAQTLLTYLQNLILGAQASAVLYFAARGLLDSHSLTLGMLVAILSFRQIISDRVLSIVNKGLQFRMLGLHVQRISDIVSADKEVKGELPGYVSCQGDIRFNDVSFRYGEADPWLFKNLSFVVSKGDFIAIVGPSGAGKTSLIKLVLGLHPPACGEILLDGQPACPAYWRQWRAQIGVVSQDDRLFSGSLSENIAFFDPDIDPGRVRVAARLAQVDKDIDAMPMGFATLVGDMGSRLSGGQRQRIFLARALYRNPKVLVLDEGTANLDTATEAAIAETIAALTVTRIVVAHRPALVDRASAIWTVRDGRVEVVRPMQRDSLAV